MVKIKTARVEAVPYYRRLIPLEAPITTKAGMPRQAQAVRSMVGLIRERQNTIADTHDLNEEYYDWEELSKRWYPTNGKVLKSISQGDALLQLPNGKSITKRSLYVKV